MIIQNAEGVLIPPTDGRTDGRTTEARFEWVLRTHARAACSGRRLTILVRMRGSRGGTTKNAGYAVVVVDLGLGSDDAATWKKRGKQGRKEGKEEENDGGEDDDAAAAATIKSFLTKRDLRSGQDCNTCRAAAPSATLRLAECCERAFRLGVGVGVAMRGHEGDGDGK